MLLLRGGLWNEQFYAAQTLPLKWVRNAWSIVVRNPSTGLDHRHISLGMRGVEGLDKQVQPVELLSCGILASSWSNCCWCSSSSRPWDTSACCHSIILAVSKEVAKYCVMQRRWIQVCLFTQSWYQIKSKNILKTCRQLEIRINMTNQGFIYQNTIAEFEYQNINISKQGLTHQEQRTLNDT